MRVFDRLWTAVLVLGLAALIFGCTSCVSVTRSASTIVQEYETRGVERMVRAAVRVRIYCDGELSGYGSGTAVSPRHILTARHIARGCKASTSPEPVTTMTVQFANGQIYEVAAQAEAATTWVDAAQLVDLEPEDFPSYAPIGYYQPRVGQRIIMYAGDGTIDLPDEHAFQFKEGHVSRTDGWRLIISSHGVPGNSGSGVFDENGYLIGILWAGRWHPSYEFYYEASRPEAWPELIPPENSVTFLP